MKDFSRLSTSLLIATLMVSFTTKAVVAQEKAKTEKAKAATAAVETKAAKSEAQSVTKVLFENEKYRVVETWAKPGEKNEMKARSDRLTYHFNAGKQKVRYSDGKTEEVEFKAGSVLFRKAGTSSTENVGKTETHNLVITAK